MIRYAALRLVGAVATLLVTAAIVFLLLGPTPGGTGEASPLDAFGHWLGGLLRGDLGHSSAQNVTVDTLVVPALAVTGPLLGVAALVCVLLGGGIGLLAARSPGSVADRGLSSLAMLIAAMPSFWVGTLLVLVFAVVLHWLPSGGFVPWSNNPVAALTSLALPALTLALPPAAMLALIVRDAFAAARGSAYVLTARGTGLSVTEAMARHGRRNAVLVVLAASGPVADGLVAGAVIVEAVFYLPGLGRVLLDAVAARDIAGVAASVMVMVLAIVAVRLALAVCAGWTDARISARQAP